MGRSRKRRKRAQASSPPLPSPSTLESLIGELDDTSLRFILLDAARAHPDIARRILAEGQPPLPSPSPSPSSPSQHDGGIDNPLRSPRVPSEYYGHYLNQVKYLLHEKYSHLRGSQQFQVGFDVASEIEGMFEHIANRCNGATFGTKRDAIKEMCVIVNEIEDVHSEVGKVVQSDAERFSKYIIAAARSFSPAEREDLRRLPRDMIGLLDRSRLTIQGVEEAYRILSGGGGV